VTRFLLGFGVASALWGALSFSYFQGAFDAWLAEPETAVASESTAEAVDPGDATGKDKRRRIRRPRLQKRTPSAPQQRPAKGSIAATGEASTGDDIEWDGPRSVSMTAGEAQLAGTQIDSGFDGVMGKIRRCLILVETDGDLSGKLLFGMRVGGDGRVKAVNLSGPSVVTGGESGGCLRAAAQGIRFPAFDGPDMLFKYPITLQ
jgi:hypothetical protein